MVGIRQELNPRPLVNQISDTMLSSQFFLNA